MPTQNAHDQFQTGQTEQADDGTLTYTANSQLATLKDAEGNLTTYEYDGFDRLAKSRYPVPATGALTSSTTDYEQLTYDARSSIIQDRRRDGQLISFSYDALGRMTLKDVPNTVIGEYDVTTSYDNLGRPINSRDCVTRTKAKDAGSVVAKYRSTACKS